jgi:hypothetical protein
MPKNGAKGGASSESDMVEEIRADALVGEMEKARTRSN